MARDNDQRDRIGGIAQESLLIDVDTDAHDARGDVAAIQGVLQQHAAHLLVLPIDVVGPLDGETIASLGRERLDDSQCRGLAQVELVAGLDGRSFEQERERQILAVLAFPGVAFLAAPCSLTGGINDRSAGQRGCQAGQIGVCTRRLIDLEVVSHGGSGGGEGHLERAALVIVDGDVHPHGVVG